MCWEWADGPGRFTRLTDSQPTVPNSVKQPPTYAGSPGRVKECKAEQGHLGSVALFGLVKRLLIRLYHKESCLSFRPLLGHLPTILCLHYQSARYESPLQDIRETEVTAATARLHKPGPWSLRRCQLEWQIEYSGCIVGGKDCNQDAGKWLAKQQISKSSIPSGSDIHISSSSPCGALQFGAVKTWPLYSPLTSPT